ncbi:Hypothetical predicted protein [Octopus vulgaris]|uniref:Uncharacterized protein n=1 Tax=Octopus vulgaris TaxID=6645 RepID=A0AA36AGE7_OCTVU|nr:Hypothetical predicted protein [Octopus vulgaris]
MIESPLRVPDYLKQLTIKDARYLSGRAWAAVSTKIIANWWNRALGAAYPQPQQPEKEEFMGFIQEEIRAAEQRLEDHLEVPVTGLTGGRKQRKPYPQQRH